MFKKSKDLKIGVRIIVGYLIIASIACCIGVIGVINLKNVQDSYAFDYNNSVKALEYVERMSSHFQQVRVNLSGFALGTDSEKLKDYYKERITYHEGVIAENIGYYNDILDDYEIYEVETELSLVNSIQEAVNNFEAVKNQLINGLETGSVSKEEFVSSLTEGGTAHDLANITEDAIRELIDYNINYASNMINKNGMNASSSIIIMNVAIIVGLAVAIWLGITISRSISVPIKKVVNAAHQLAEGDMDIVFDFESKDETGMLVDAFKNLVASTKEQAIMVEKIADGDLTVNVPIRSEKDLLGRKLSEMAQNLNYLMLNIASAAEQVSVGAKQISDSSMTLSQGAEEQASSIEELSASIEEVSSQTKDNAESAERANNMAEKAKVHAVTGNTHMKEMLKAMDGINESSKNINKIIKVIDDIAFQTNILALNAAVEAARAGQHGKGFAVVAEEVRTLAGRSANAAKETTDLIEDSIKKSEDGTKIAKETAEALEKIVEGVEAVSNLVNHINKASNDQATAIEQINQGITQVSNVVQLNSATSEESAAASEELSSQAAVLKEMVGKFKLKKSIAGSNSLNELSPEVLKMLEEMSEKKKAELKQENIQEKGNKPKEAIVLSDSEFGKY